MSKIKCLICGAELKSINSTHSAKHGITLGQYQEKFPDAPLICDESRKKRSSSLVGREITWRDKISRSNTKAWKDGRITGRTGIPLSDASRKSLSKKMTGHFVSDECRKKIRESSIGRTPWNKGLQSSSNWDCKCSRCTRDKSKLELLFNQYGFKPEIIGKKEYASLKAEYSKILPEWE